MVERARATAAEQQEEAPARAIASAPRRITGATIESSDAVPALRRVHRSAVRRQSARGLSRCARSVTEQMQTLTREMNFSESTFILPAEAAGHRHAHAHLHARRGAADGRPPDDRHARSRWRTLGVIAAGRERWVFGLGVGPTPVELTWQGSAARFRVDGSAPAGAIASRSRARRHDPAHAASIPSAVDATGLPVEEISCGVPFTFVPVQTRAAVDAAEPDLGVMRRLKSAFPGDHVGVFVFSTEAGGCRRHRLQPHVRARRRHCRGPRDRRRQRPARLLPREARAGAKGSDARHGEPAGREDGPAEPHSHEDHARTRAARSRACRSAARPCASAKARSISELELTKARAARATTSRRAPRIQQPIVQPALAALPEFDRLGRDAVAAPERRQRHHLPVCSAVSVGEASFERGAVGTARLCADAHAPIWLSNGREWKYCSDSSRGTRVTLPVMRTWRSSSAQKNSRHARGLSASSRPFALS